MAVLSVWICLSVDWVDSFRAGSATIDLLFKFDLLMLPSLDTDTDTDTDTGGLDTLL